MAAFGPVAASEFIESLLIAKYLNVNEEEEIEAATSDIHGWIEANALRLGMERGSEFRKFITSVILPMAARYAQARTATLKVVAGSEPSYCNEFNGIPHHLAAAMAPMRANESEADSRRKAALVEKYLDLLYVRRVLDGTASQAADIEREVLSLILRLRDCGDVKALASLLGSELAEVGFEWVNMTTFGLGQNNRAHVRYLLARLTAFVEAEVGRQNLLMDYLSPEHPYNIEHVVPDDFTRYQGEDWSRSEFASLRNRLGALLLLPASDNSSYGADAYEDKINYYLRQNLLAASMHPNCHRRYPRFVRFVEANNLSDDFAPSPHFAQAEILRRQELCRRLCELVWEPSRLGFVVPGDRRPVRRRPPDRKRFNVRVSDLVKVDLLTVGERLFATNRGEEYTATITDEGRVRLPTGETYDNPSPAGQFVLGRACPGWDFWHVQRDGRRVPLADIRNEGLRRGLVV